MQISIFASKTPTPTLTFTPTITFTPTATFTETPIPSLTSTPTPSAPFEYIVQDGDFLASIAEKYGLGADGVQLMILLNPAIDPVSQIISPGQRLLIPNPDMKLPTATPIPPDLARGTKITHIVQSGDSLEAIAFLYNSTVEAIIAIKDNNITSATDVIFVGQPIIVPVNLVTPVPTATATP
jgi:LysM repeat protein